MFYETVTPARMSDKSRSFPPRHTSVLPDENLVSMTWRKDYAIVRLCSVLLLILSNFFIDYNNFNFLQILIF